MSLSFGNLLGFWALLGIPAVLLIHFLQRRSRPVVISTLFLLDQMQRESVSGNRIERLRSSVPLWLQLFAVLLLTWLLTDPRWTRNEAVQRVAIVLDSSASMSVFKTEAIEQLDTAIADLESLVTTTEFVVLETSGGAGLYTGTDHSRAKESLTEWETHLGTHDPAPALRLARSTVGASGLVIFVTDHVQPQAPPFDARLLAIGTPKENCGFAGFTVQTAEDGQLLWKTLVRNYGALTQKRKWWLQTGNQRTLPAELTLEPGKVIPLQGSFPDSAAQCTLVMEADTFTFDDKLPMVVPKPKQLRVWIRPGEDTDGLGNFYHKVFGNFENVTVAANRAQADLTVMTYDPLNPVLPANSACLFAQDPRQRSKFLSGQIVTVAHSLVDGLNWQGLLCRESVRIPARDNDDVVLWQGERPLIFVRSSGDVRQLCFNFDLRKSNAQRLPAFAVLLHRFLATVRESKVASESRNFEVGQSLQLTRHRQPDAPPLVLTTAGSSVELSRERSDTLRAPANADFFEIHQGEQQLLAGATHFADTREADFRAATSSFSAIRDAQAAVVDRPSQSDGHWRLWVLLLLAFLLFSWHFARRPSSSSTTSVATA